MLIHVCACVCVLVCVAPAMVVGAWLMVGVLSQLLEYYYPIEHYVYTVYVHVVNNTW